MEKRTAEVILYKDFLAYKTTWESKTTNSTKKGLIKINNYQNEECLFPKSDNLNNLKQASQKLISSANKIKECADRLSKLAGAFKL